MSNKKLFSSLGDIKNQLGDIEGREELVVEYKRPPKKKAPKKKKLTEMFNSFNDIRQQLLEDGISEEDLREKCIRAEVVEFDVIINELKKNDDNPEVFANHCEELIKMMQVEKEEKEKEKEEKEKETVKEIMKDDEEKNESDYDNAAEVIELLMKKDEEIKDLKSIIRNLKKKHTIENDEIEIVLEEKNKQIEELLALVEKNQNITEKINKLS